jgi:hypothetical protein
MDLLVQALFRAGECGVSDPITVAIHYAIISLYMHRSSGTKCAQVRVDTRLVPKLEVQVVAVADGAQMNQVGHKLVDGSIRAMNHPDQKYIVNRAIGSYNALVEAIFMYGGGETYRDQGSH